MHIPFMSLCRLLAVLLLLPAVRAQGGPGQGNDDPAARVNPFIGTTHYGTCNPGAVLPHGMMSCTPFNVTGSELNRVDKDTRWWSTPYEHDNVFFTGFAHVNLSGTGCPDLGALLTCATMDSLDVDLRRYGSTYTDEQASPGYYACTLVRHEVRAEATATLRTSRERYTFGRDGRAHILLNLGEGLTNESGATVRRVSATEWEGSKLLGTFCYNPQAVFPIYFVMRVHTVPARSGFWKKQRPMTGIEAEWTPDQGSYKLYTRYGRDLSGDDIGVWADFDVAAGEQVEVSLGVSFVSTANARENLDREQAGKTFDALHAEARTVWNQALGRIETEGGTDDDRTIFYTALYHALLHPNVLQDSNGQYPLMESDGVGHTDGTRYTVLSLWDTYRTVGPLLTLLYPEVQRDIIRSMTAMADESGHMPKWELYGRETHTMDGDPAASYIADAYVRGLRGFDAERAYAHLHRSALDPDSPLRPYNREYMQLGFVPLTGGFDTSVSFALEYCQNDFALSRLANALGHKDDAALLARRSLNWRKYYDPDTGALRPLHADGTFLQDFNPRQGENFSAPAGFHEGSAWNYTFAASHDVEGLVRLMGGPKQYAARLQRIFDEDLYDPGNEPDIVYPYLFARLRGHEHKAAPTARRLLARYFGNSPGGLPGNDDAGTLSAWALFTMAGLYPDTPGEAAWTLTAPVFTRVVLHLDPATWGRDRLVIESDGDDRLEAVRRFRLTQDELLRAGTLRLF